ncbi:MAG: hypothetical protein AAF533_08945 [Acidobacteriota bacterium]
MSFKSLLVITLLVLASPVSAQTVARVDVGLDALRVESGTVLTSSGTLHGEGDGTVSYRWVAVVPRADGGTDEIVFDDGGADFEVALSDGRAVLPDFTGLPTTFIDAGEGYHEAFVRVVAPESFDSRRRAYIVLPASSSVRGDFLNAHPWMEPAPGTGVGTLAHPGEVCLPESLPPGESCPESSEAVLLEWSAGEPVLSNGVDQQLLAELVEQARALLHDGPEAALRYQTLLYAEHPTLPGEVVNQLDARLLTMADLYGEPERARFAEAEKALRLALRHAPTYEVLQHALLDLYQARTVAEVALAQDLDAEARRRRFEAVIAAGTTDDCISELSVVASGGAGTLERPLDDEIALLEMTLGGFTGATRGGYRYALSTYLGLLQDRLGVDTASVVDPPPEGNPPFGYFMFQSLVPTRARMAPTYLMDGVTPMPVVDADGDGMADEIFGGYSDLVLLFTLLRDHADVVEEMAKLLVLRGEPRDRDRALEVVSEAQRELHLQGTLLLGVFRDDPDFPPDSSEGTGLPEAIARWRAALTQLNDLKLLVEEGSVNPLGFPDDFLMLIEGDTAEFTEGNASSFDRFRIRMMDAGGEPVGALLTALDLHCAALLERDTYQATRDQVATELQDSRDEIDGRLIELNGVPIGDPDFDGFSAPANTTGEIWSQFQSVEVARLDITRNRQRMDNLHRQVEIEIARRGAEAGVEQAINQVVVRYGSKQAKLTEEIAFHDAMQKSADELALAADGISVTTGGFPPGVSVTASPGVAAHAANAVFGFYNEQKKGDLAARKERLAAAETAEINDLEGRILDINSRAQIKTWMLEAALISIDSAESSILLAQEVGRLHAMLNERERLIRRWEEAEVAAADRFHADPLHRVRQHSLYLAADKAFRKAQLRTWFMARALEYKWNTRFDHDWAIEAPGGGNWTSDSVFRLRTAPELLAMVRAMNDYNDEVLLGGGVGNAWFDVFSVREDFLGFRSFDGMGEPILYPDLDSGELLSAEEAFRRHLGRLVATVDDPAQDVNAGDVVLEFSTVRDGPSDSALFRSSAWLDRLDWMQVTLLGGQPISDPPPQNVLGRMTYGGTSYVRNQSPGMPDPARPDRLLDEMTAWSTRYWVFDIAAGDFRSREALTSDIALWFTAVPGEVPPEAAEVRVFQERSVAATGWRLVVPTRNATGEALVVLEELEDILIKFAHYSKDR